MKRILFYMIVPWLQFAWAAQPVNVVLDVPGMTCGSCPITVRLALKKVPGVQQVQAELDSKTATIVYDPDQATVQMLIQATTEAGYASSLHEQDTHSQ